MPIKRSTRIGLSVFGIVALAVIGLGEYANRGAGKPDYVFANGRSLMENVEGRWDWSTRAKPCGDSTHLITFSEDGKTMTITVGYPVAVDSGERDWSVTTYDIVDTTPSRIRGAIRGETRTTGDGKPVVWDLVAIGANEYAWHRTDWTGRGQTAPNVRCPSIATVAGVGSEQPNLTHPDSGATPSDSSDETTHRAATEVAERYRGFVVHNQLPDKQVSLELSVFSRGDSATTGWLVSGAPLDTKGLTWLIESGDSLYLVTHGAADTIVWASETRTGRIGGEFWVNAGPNAGKGGTWHLEPAPRLSVATLSLVTVLLAGGMLLGIFAVAAFGAERWWRWRATRPLDVPAEKRAQLTGVGGWLILVIIGQVVVALTQLIRIGEVGDALGETWMLGAALPGMRPLLLLESAVHVFQMAAIVGGVLLITRRSRMAPPYWQAFLAVMFTYAVLDIAATAALSDDMVAIFGADAATEFDTETAKARRLNVRLAFWAAVWTLYWMRSRRVALTFRPAEAAALPDAAVATDYRLPDPAAGHEQVKP